MSLIALLAVSGMAGWLLVRPLELSIPERVGLSLLTGMCLCSVLVIGVGSVSLAAARVSVVLVAIVLVACVLWREGVGRQRRPLPSAPHSGSFEAVELLALTVIIAGSGIALISALAPNTSWDAGVAHLALPSDYVREGRIQLFEGNSYSAYPHLLHALYTLAYFDGGERAAALLNWLFGPLGCIALYSFGRAADSRATGLIAAAIFASSPIFFDQTGTVAIDGPFTASVACALGALLFGIKSGSGRWIVIAGLVAGSSCGMRHTGYLVCVLMTAGALFMPATGRLRCGAIFAGVAALGAAPWLLRTAILVGNPFHPFFPGLFASDALPDIQKAVFGGHKTVEGMGPLDLVLFPWNITLHPERFDGWAKSPGALALFLGLPGVFMGSKRNRWLGGFSAAGFICFFYFQRFARYLLPFFAPLMVTSGVAYVHMGRWKKPLLVLLTVSFAYGLVIGAGTVSFKVRVALGLESREAYLTRRVERFEAFAWVNENIAPEETIATFDPRTYFIRGRTFANLEMMRELSDLTLEEELRWYEEHEIRYFFCPVTYLDESPVSQVFEFNKNLQRWRDTPEHFQLVKSMTTPRARSEGMEHVEIYKISYAPLDVTDPSQRENDGRP